MPSSWNEMACTGCLPSNTSGESGHWTMLSSDAPNQDDDIIEEPELEHPMKREEREREKGLQKKIGELQSQSQRLERRIMLLRTENDGLKKKQEDQKPLEEKVKVLKKRNAELAAIARRLEEKAKALQQENAKNKAKVKEEIMGTTDGDHLKRMFSRQRAKDLAEHAKNMLAKDREIEELRKKCQQLADQLSNGDVMAPQNVQIYEEKEELVNIVKQAAKERLQLEQQLAHSKTKERSQTDDQEREKQKRELEAANEILHKEIEKLENALKQSEGLKDDLSEKEAECDRLRVSLVQAKEESAELENELQSTSAKNTQFALQVAGLEDQVKDLNEVKEECSTLRVTLAAAQTDRETAKEQVSSLQTRVNSLENLVRDLQDSAEQLQRLEDDYKDALSKLATRQSQIDQLQETQKQNKVEHQKSVTDLQTKVKELEDKCQSQEQRQQELNAELQTLRQQKTDLDKALKQQQAQALRQRQSSPVTPGGIPPSDSADSGLPASSTNSDEGVSLQVHSKGADTSPGLHLSAPDTSSKSHDTDPEDSGMENRKSTLSEQRVGNDSGRSALGMRGPIQVYVAKYSYNPFEYSPNENPEAELQLNAGDYVLVLADMDEDGFYEGELMDGKRGLVPSNFIERVADEDLGEFHAALALSGGNDDNNQTKPGPSPLESDNEDMANGSFGLNGQLNKNILNNNNSSDAPYPQQLVLERQLTTSILISWQPPQDVDSSSIQAYHVYLNGALKATLKGSERRKALLEDVDANKNHRVSVRCLSNQGQSKESQCTLLIGRDVLPVPSDLGVRNVTQSSACVYWLPGNSNYSHCILLNRQEIKVVKPGVCHYTLTGLAPDTVYCVTIATKPPSGTYIEKHKWTVDKVSCNIELKTLAGGAVPDPPLNVQVEAGPRECTLLLTWLPVTINSSGFSNGAVVTGYVVYADGSKMKEAKGPTNDHMVLGKEDLKGYVPKQLTVRTATVDKLESADSAAVWLPHTLVKEMTAASARIMASEAVRASNRRKSPKVAASGTGDHPGHETDEEIEAAFQDREHSSPEIEAEIAEPFTESSSSELSDILEVEEELGADETNQNGDTSEANVPSQPEKVRKSPKATPRKLSPSRGQSSGDKAAEFSPKQFHGQKPDPSRKDGLLTTPMIVPAIEITRDSSTERGGSFDDDPDGASNNASPSPADRGTQRRQPAVKDDVMQKGHDPVTHRYRSSGGEPSAFRSVEQGRQQHSTLPDTHQSPDNESSSRNASQRPGSGQRHGSARNTPTNKNKEERSHEDKSHSNSVSDVAPSKPSRQTPLTAEESADRDSITEEINTVIDDSTVRLFIALFDYDPVTMSPNVDCVDEELPFREGQILKVYGDKDADGFYRGEADGQEGYIPCNMVSEIHIDDPELVEQLLKENQTTVQQSHSTDRKDKVEGQLTPNGMAPLPASGPARRMVALYDYDPQELSPNVDSELELAFKQGDIIYISGEMDEDGFYSGELNGVGGLVPSNFLQDAPLSDEDEVLESASMVSPSRSQGSISAASRRSDSLSTLNNTSGKDRLSLSPPVERAIVLDVPNDSSTAGPVPDEEKRKKKGGLLNKGRSIFKKFAR